MSPEDEKRIRQIFREEIAIALASQQQQSGLDEDMKALALLPPEERKKRLKLMRMAA